MGFQPFFYCQQIWAARNYPSGNNGVESPLKTPMIDTPIMSDYFIPKDESVSEHKNGELSMYENEIAINQLLLNQFEAIMADLPEDSLFTPGTGHGHPPVWILGHLAFVGELGQTFLGGSLSHPKWAPQFGPGSSDKIQPETGLTRDALIAANLSAYETLRTLAANAKPEDVAQPHGIELFDGSPIQTVSHAISLLLTNHFGFHLAQLSSCRRERGKVALF